MSSEIRDDHELTRSQDPPSRAAEDVRAILLKLDPYNRTQALHDCDVCPDCGDDLRICEEGKPPQRAPCYCTCDD
jgi:hypothetical protein